MSSSLDVVLVGNGVIGDSLASDLLRREDVPGNAAIDQSLTHGTTIIHRTPGAGITEPAKQMIIQHLGHQRAHHDG